MMIRMLAALGLLSALLATNARAQQDEAKIKQGGTGPVPMSTLLADLKASAPQTRTTAIAPRFFGVSRATRASNGPG